MSLPTVQVDIRQHSNNTHFRSINNLTFLLDSGTNKSIIAADALENANIQTAKLAKPLCIANALKSISKPVIFEYMLTNLFFPENNKELPNQKLLIVKSPLEFDGILGMDILADRTIEFGATPVFINSFEIKFEDPDPCIFVNSTTIEEPNTGYCAKIICKEDATIQPYSSLYVKCATKWTDRSFKPKKLFLMATGAVEKANCGFNEVHESTRNLLRIFNNSPNIVFLPEEQLLAKGFDSSQNLLSQEEFQIVSNYLLSRSEASAEDRKTLDMEAKEWKEKRNLMISTIPIKGEIQKTLEGIQGDLFRNQMSRILHKYDKIFSRHSNDSGLNGSYLVDLQLKDQTNTEPTFCRPYKLDPEIEAKLEEKCREMQEGGILETCSSAWNSPALAIRKKDGKYRLVNNYSTGVNERLVQTNYPIPPIRSLNAAISATISAIRRKSPTEQIFFSSLDLKNGFYVLSVAKSARDKTAFIIGRNQFRYARLSMGLSLSPSCFQHFLSLLFLKKPLGIEGAQIHNYMDDFLLVSGESTHAMALEKFFQICAENQIVLSLEKCSFFKKEAEFLGLIVNAHGFFPKQSKIDALLRMGYPTTKREAQRIMGSFNFYSRQVPKVTALLDPFAQAVAKKEFIQSEVMRKSLDELKSLLKKGALTAHLDYSTEGDNVVFIATDCSLRSCGFVLGNATLNEDDELKIKSISHYGSKALPNVCMLLSARSRELIALATGLDTFRDLLPNTLKFVALVDHRSLSNISKSKNFGKTSSDTRARRALATILNYPNMRILYVPGSDPILQIADALSRPTNTEMKELQAEELDPTFLDPKTELPDNLSINHLETVDVSRAKLIEEQKNDPYLGPILEKLGNRSEAVIGNKQYFLKEKVLMAQVGSGAVLTVVPDSLAKVLIDMLHIQILHGGEQRLLNAVNRSNFLFRGKNKLVKNATRQCVFCQLRLTSKFRREPNIDVPIRPGLQPWKRVNIDLMDISGYGTSNCYLLTFVCVFSKFCDCEIISRKSSDVVVPALILLISRNGGEAQMEIGSDRGREFLNEALKSAYKSLNVFGHTQSAYNSRTNCAERVHKELRILMKVLEPTSTDFKFKMNLAVNYYNSLPSIRLGNRSPREILTGCPPRRLLTHLHPEDLEPSEDFSDPNEDSYSKWEEYLTALHNQHAIREIDRFNGIEVPKSSFKPKDLVMILDPIINLSKSRSPRATGPYIVEKVDKNTLTLRHCIDHSRLTRNARFVRKMCLSDEDREFLINHQENTYKDNKILTPNLLKFAEQISLNIDEPEETHSNQRYSLRPRK